MLGRRGSAGSAASCPGRVVLVAADVVVGVVRGGLRVHGVGVEHEDVGAEALVREHHALHEVLRGHDPAAALPRVGDLLVPGVVELEAAVVVVAQDAQPWLAVEARAAVDPLEDVVEHALRQARHHVHGAAAVLGDAGPVEVVPDVDDVVRRAVRGVEPHLLGDLLLCNVVSASHKRPRIASGVPGPRRAVVCRVGRHADAAPVPYDEGAVRSLGVEARVRQGHAVEVRGVQRGRRQPEPARAVRGHRLREWFPRALLPDDLVCVRLVRLRREVVRRHRL
mmetsp:Transcript_21338/g.67440  ORF Transcript_21338/g.67440 Transcript_21338/m.67440 type:complete len:280 (+) Transcript_21338:369-1208(+)